MAGGRNARSLADTGFQEGGSAAAYAARYSEPYRGRAADELPQHENNNDHLTLTRDNSTIMDPIQAAIKAVDSREPGASFRTGKSLGSRGLRYRVDSDQGIALRRASAKPAICIS
jgi:hypothetical protein